MSKDLSMLWTARADWVDAEDGTIVCREPGIGPDSTGQWPVRRRLIAAAPDLLAALQAAIECGMVPVSSVAEGGAVKYIRQVHVADQIRAAIAKAEGREP
jgi:hypothetical protein